MWCECQRCANWENQQERECVCCHEIDEAVAKMSGENSVLSEEIGINFRISAVSFCVFICAETCPSSIYTFTGINCFDCVVLDRYAEGLSEDEMPHYIALFNTPVSILFVCEGKCWRRPLSA